jgi:methyl coenzyme M reductase alpha subunit
LIFIAPTDKELSFSGLGGEIVADGSQVARWTTREAGGSGIDAGSLAGGETGISAYGEFAAITLQTNQLNQIAQASDVEGTLGGKPLRFGGGMKEGLKKLVQKM